VGIDVFTVAIDVFTVGIDVFTVGIDVFTVAVDVFTVGIDAFTVGIDVFTVCIDVFPLDAGLLARGQYSEGPATGQLDTGFSWFPRVFKQREGSVPGFGPKRGF
jgi:hypothetical protein